MDNELNEASGSIDPERIKTLLTSDLGETLVSLTLYLRSRERTSQVTDISQMLVNMRSQSKVKISRKDLVAILKVFEEMGVGTLGDQEGRKKFSWNFWVFPLMDIANNKLLDLTFQPIDQFTHDKSLFRHIKNSIEKNELRRASAEESNQRKIDSYLSGIQSAVEKPSMNSGRSLGLFSLEDLLSEIEGRGWEINLKKKVSK